MRMLILMAATVNTKHTAQIGSYFFLPSDIRSSVLGQYPPDTDAVDRIGTSLVLIFYQRKPELHQGCGMEVHPVL